MSVWSNSHWEQHKQFQSDKWLESQIIVIHMYQKNLSYIFKERTVYLISSALENVSSQQGQRFCYDGTIINAC